MNRSVVRALVLVAGLAAPLSIAVAVPSAPALVQPGASIERLPVSGITLYRSGVGYFERRGLIEGDQDVQLRFATDQINDILKSMVLLDLDGGRIDTVRYGSKEPLERRLASFGVDISDNPALGDLLNRLRGAPVQVSTPDGWLKGTILGVEIPPTPAGKDGAVVQTPHLNLVTDTGIKAVNVTQVSAFDILDKDLAAELSKALEALAEHRADRVKSVDLTLRGNGTRQVVVAYVHEMPVWKTSYRLVLPDQPEARPGETRPNEGGLPTIQGWAIVENTTDEDWQDVRLSLVAGRPVSFQMDLYEPLHVERPEIPVPTVPGVAPRVYADAGVYRDKAELQSFGRPAESPATSAAKAAGAREEMRRGADRLSNQAGREGQLGLSADDLARYAAQTQAQAGEVGEVFQYQLKSPVTLERQRSAMLPILSSAIDGRRVSIYNRADGSEHPMRGVELKNNSGLQLMPGPISVFDGAAYAGDAQIGHVSIGDKRLLAYAVDLDVGSLTTDETTYNLQSIKIVDGLIEQTTKQRNRVGYAFTNKDAKRGRTVLVEHPKSPGWTLIEPAKPLEETQELYRFEVLLEPGKSGSLAVVQEWVEQRRLDVTSYDLPTLVSYVQSGKVSQAVVDAVRKAAAMQAAVNEAQRRIAQLDQERQSIGEDQARIRQNMTSIDRNTDLYRRYTTKLNEQETRLEQIKVEREKAEADRQRLQAELASYIRGLNVE